MTETAKLTSSTPPPTGWPYAGLGLSVSISGNTVVAGAPLDSVDGNFGEGATYVFVEPPGGWASMTETAKLTASDGVGGEFLGWSVSIDGNTAVAGAINAPTGTAVPLGAAYVFTQPESGWADATETAKLTSSDTESADFFGSTLSISGGTVVVGALGHTVGSNPGQGAAYVFTLPAQEQIANLENAVSALVSAGTLNPSLGQSLLAPLNAALEDLAGGQTTIAISELNVFIRQVRDLVLTRRLTTAEGQSLINAAQSIITALGS
jgi:hypothetical protein